MLAAKMKGAAPCRMVYLTETPPDAVQGMFADCPELLTVQTLSGLLGQSEQTVRKILANGAIPGAVKIGVRWYLPKPRFIEYCMNGGTIEEA